MSQPKEIQREQFPMTEERKSSFQLLQEAIHRTKGNIMRAILRGDWELKQQLEENLTALQNWRY